MKRKLISVAMLLGIAFGAKAQKPTFITGDLQTSRISKMHLFKVKDGKTVEIAEQDPSKDGKFGFIFYPEYEGLYVLGTGNGASMMDTHTFYFKGNDKLSLIISDSSYVLNGKENSKENVILTQWHDFVRPIEKKAVYFMKGNSTYVDFFPQFEAVVAQSKTFMKGKPSGNPRFDAEMQKIIKLDLVSYGTNFLNTPRTAHPSVEEYSPYFVSLNVADYTQNTALIYNYPYGIRLMDGVLSIASRKKSIKWVPGPIGVSHSTDMIPNDTLKGEIVLESLEHLKSYAAYKAIADTLGKYIITDNQKSRNVAIATPLASLKLGEDGYKFSYPDQNDKTVSLTDLKGKVVVVDVWATWCGPCRQETPYMRKLADEMKGQDVAFISMSVDKVKDHDKWKQMLVDEKMTWIQLFATENNDFSKYYKVATIPRFIVFDKAGKIVNVDAPRPSDPELKKLLEKTLAAK
ncbi:TlpA family protein disulfide reductase [Mucilaginibacter jinjuensis]|uniref:TlpA disulfide reductase family protein n=1 Tax=Mucilaginibacter jinjuensis TaxID=1176721 RepID=A0ABY7T2K4_9SPHI|nr:TlpA disulfide reductase family protein [Mucilaginibacter jinjuensis]WCT10679.1 TlpA disulfide reductase family protein [Mucilaginibacter jinjuensis]